MSRSRFELFRQEKPAQPAWETNKLHGPNGRTSVSRCFPWEEAPLAASLQHGGCRVHETVHYHTQALQPSGRRGLPCLQCLRFGRQRLLSRCASRGTRRPIPACRGTTTGHTIYSVVLRSSCSAVLHVFTVRPKRSRRLQVVQVRNHFVQHPKGGHYGASAVQNAF